MPDIDIPAMRHEFEAEVELFRMEHVPCFDSKRLGRYGRQREVGGMAKTENHTQGRMLHNRIVFFAKVLRQGASNAVGCRSACHQALEFAG